MRQLIIVSILFLSALQTEAQIFRPPTPYLLSFIAKDSLQFHSVNHRAFRVYFREGSYTASHLSEMITELDLAWERILDVLQMDIYPHGIHLIAVDSKEDMQDLMGYKIKGGAALGQDLVFFVYNAEIRPQFKHEIFHLLAYESWGPTPHRLLDEGGATFTDDFCFYPNPMYSIPAYYLQNNMLFSMQSLIDNFDEKARENDVIAYIQSAGIFKYLYEHYGVEKMRQLWQQGFDHFEKIYGFEVSRLEEDWLEFIGKVPLPPDFDLAKLAEGCG